MNYAYDRKLKKWVVILNSDIVHRIFDTEQECIDFIKEKANSAATKSAQ